MCENLEVEYCEDCPFFADTCFGEEEKRLVAEEEEEYKDVLLMLYRTWMLTGTEEIKKGINKVKKLIETENKYNQLVDKLNGVCSCCKEKECKGRTNVAECIDWELDV